ncbi:MAG: hypothetical protein EZS28_042373, partial [Streblomastix strix]
ATPQVGFLYVNRPYWGHNADALEKRERQRLKRGVCDRNKDNEASRSPLFLINQDIEQFEFTQADKLIHLLLRKTDPPATSPI